MLEIGNLKIKIFVISLKGCSERRNFIIKEFSKAKLDFEFIDAIDGTLLSLNSNPEINFDIISQSSKWLTPGILGASLSHLKCYKKIMNENLDFAIIFEDDVKIKIKDIINLTGKILLSTSSDSLTLFYYQSFDKIELFKRDGIELCENSFLFKVDGSYNLVSGAGYIIGRKACEKMIDILLPVHIGPDCWQYLFNKDAFKNLFIVYPMPICTMNFRSTVTNLNLVEGRTFKSRLSYFIDKYKIPILNQILKLRREKNKKNFHGIHLIDK